MGARRPRGIEHRDGIGLAQHHHPKVLATDFLAAPLGARGKNLVAPPGLGLNDIADGDPSNQVNVEPDHCARRRGHAAARLGNAMC